MEPDKNTTPAEEEIAADAPQAPADSLSRTPEDLATDPVAQAAAAAAAAQVVDPDAKQVSPIRRFLQRINIYLLVFILLTVISAAIAVVNFLNSQKPVPLATVQSQNLTTDTLKQLANTDATVGSSSQTLNFQGNAIIAGQTLARGNLNVAGNILAGGSIQGASLTIAGTTNLSNTQISTLQVASNTAIQGTTTLRDVNVSGTSSFNGPLTAAQITTSKLVLSGNGTLTISNHINIIGPSPNRSINNGVIGNSGSASVSGSDTAGIININSGNNPSAGCLVRIIFQQSFSSLPHVTVTPVGAAAGQIAFYITQDQSGFSVCGNNAAAPNQAFAFDYFVTN